MTPLVTLTTDFGRLDPYVAAMKGVLYSLAPDVRIVDVSHEVPPFDVLRGAFVLDGAIRWFPPGTVHVAVVDPGVGTARDLVGVEAAGQVILAPDNGLVTRILARWPWARAFRVATGAYDLPVVTSTFHGRDRLAPLAAALATGAVLPSGLGPPIEPVRLAGLDASVGPGRVTGRVLYADRFGNLVTSVTRDDARAAFGEAAFRVQLAGRELGGVRPTYAAGAGAGVFPLWGSDDRLELAVLRGSASDAVPPADREQLTLVGSGGAAHEG